MVHESKHQQAVIKWSQQSSIRSKWPALALLHHIKNETREGAKQIAIGYRCQEGRAGFVLASTARPISWIIH